MIDIFKKELSDVRKRLKFKSEIYKSLTYITVSNFLPYFLTQAYFLPDIKKVQLCKVMCSLVKEIIVC